MVYTCIDMYIKTDKQQTKIMLQNQSNKKLMMLYQYKDWIWILKLS